MGKLKYKIFDKLPILVNGVNCLYKFTKDKQSIYLFGELHINSKCDRSSTLPEFMKMYFESNKDIIKDVFIEIKNINPEDKERTIPEENQSGLYQLSIDFNDKLTLKNRGKLLNNSRFYDIDSRFYIPNYKDFEKLEKIYDYLFKNYSSAQSHKSIIENDIKNLSLDTTLYKNFIMLIGITRIPILFNKCVFKDIIMKFSEKIYYKIDRSPVNFVNILGIIKNPDITNRTQNLDVYKFLLLLKDLFALVMDSNTLCKIFEIEREKVFVFTGTYHTLFYKNILENSGYTLEFSLNSKTQNDCLEISNF
jgi:hypothetical protein